MSSDQELDDRILSVVKPRWLKTARIIAQTLEELGIQPADSDAYDQSSHKVAERIERLVQLKRLESQGDLSLWRFSEVQLPSRTE